MPKSGPQPWYERIDAGWRRTIDAALDAGEETPREIHARLQLGEVISWQNLNKYAAARREAIAPESVAAVGGLVETIVADYPDLTETERMLLTLMVDKLVTAKKASTVAGGLRALNDLLRVRIERRKDSRAAEAHQAKMRDVQAKVYAAATVDAATGRKTVDLETVAKLLEEADLGQ